MSEYRHTEDMGEISGFGGGYEQCCQDMLEAGCKLLLDDEPDLNPRFKGFKDVFGVVTEDNDDAKRLTDAVIGASGNDATGAMHHAVINRLLWIKAHSWDEYCRELRNREITQS